MKRYTILSIAAALCLTMAASCDVHEFPGKPGSVDIALDLEFTTDMPELTTVNFKTRAAGDDTRDIRYIVCAYPVVGGKELTSPSLRQVFTKDPVGELPQTVTITLEARKYKVRVWTDYTAQGSEDDLYYKADDFAGIALAQQNQGSDDFKDAFAGSCDIDLSDIIGETHEALHYTVPMQRPLAKFIFITTDLEEFSRNHAGTFSLSGAGSPSDAPGATLDISGLRSDIYYTSYMPCLFNMFTDKPIDSVTGARFSSSITDIGGGEAVLGYDYVFVNGKQSEITMALSLVDAEGTVISTITGIAVPLSRSRLTIIKGKFLTEGTQSGVAINPEFEGEYNIVIQ